MTGRYGIMGEFREATTLVEAARRLRGDGYALEAYTPFSVDGLPEALGLKRSALPLVTFVGGAIGGLGLYLLQWWSAAIDYPIDVGGRGLDAWPAFIPATFELTVLGAALAAFVGFLVLNGLPRLRHPVFDAPDFDLASRNRFFLCVRVDDRENFDDRDMTGDRQGADDRDLGDDRDVADRREARHRDREHHEVRRRLLDAGACRVVEVPSL